MNLLIFFAVVFATIVFAIVFYTDIIPYITTWVLKSMIWLVDLIIGLFV